MIVIGFKRIYGSALNWTAHGCLKSVPSFHAALIRLLRFFALATFILIIEGRGRFLAINKPLTRLYGLSLCEEVR